MTELISVLFWLIVFFGALCGFITVLFILALIVRCARYVFSKHNADPDRISNDHNRDQIKGDQNEDSKAERWCAVDSSQQ